MTGDSKQHGGNGRLRDDLQCLSLPGGRDCVVIDDIAGKFARTTRVLWDALTQRREQAHYQTETASLRPTQDSSDSVNEATAWWQQAARAGWTRSRTNGAARYGWSLLSIRLPIASIDPLAQRLVPFSGIVFSPTAAVCWMVAAIVAVGMLLVRWESWSGSVPSLTVYLASLQPLTLIGIFVVTKSLHELGHAVLCKRLGSRCGVAGIWLLCLMPCPYVDVTDVWRQRSSLRRAAVMAGGMIVEGVVATIAIWVWLLSGSAELRLAMMNVVLVCGVSTLLFNANPLMRYDGYFILSDFVDTTNLREEARRSWRGLLTGSVSRWCQVNLRSVLMAAYHLASSVYRWVLLIAIASMLLALSDTWGGWRIAFLIVMAAVFAAGTRSIRKWTEIAGGRGIWSSVSPLRRMTLSCGSVVVVLLLLFLPVPRFRHAKGTLRAADAQAVFLPTSGPLHGGVIQSVLVQVGDQVQKHQLIATVRNDAIQMKLAEVTGEQSVLRQRRRAARLASLDQALLTSDRRNSSATASSQWDLLDAADSALQQSVDELSNRQAELQVRSPVTGVVLTPKSFASTATSKPDANADSSMAVSSLIDDLSSPPLEASQNEKVVLDAFVLSPHPGEVSLNQNAWCRVASSNRLEAVFPIDAHDRERISLGTEVRVSVDAIQGVCLSGRVVSMSPLHSGSTSYGHSSDSSPSSPLEVDQASYQVVCEFTSLEDLDAWQPALKDLPVWDGAASHAVFHLSAQPLWQTAASFVRSGLGY